MPPRTPLEGLLTADDRSWGVRSGRIPSRIRPESRLRLVAGLLAAVTLTGACAGADPELAPPPAEAGADLPYGPTAEDAVALYVEVVLGRTFVGDCAGAPDAVGESVETPWCYERGADPRIGPVGEPAWYALRLSESGEGWRVEEQLDSGER